MACTNRTNHTRDCGMGAGLLSLGGRCLKSRETTEKGNVDGGKAEGERLKETRKTCTFSTVGARATATGSSSSSSQQNHVNIHFAKF